MSGSTTPPGSAVDVVNATLTPSGPWPGPGAALSGDPQAAELEMVEDDRVSVGVWECTPGEYRSSKSGLSEFMHIVAGDATITGDDGTVHEARPGVAIYLPDGWSGTWTIRETVRKAYVVVTTAEPR